MKLFNAFQLMLLFAAGPFIIQYCRDASFYAHGVLTFILAAAYLVGFGAMTTILCEELNSKE